MNSKYSFCETMKEVVIFFLFTAIVSGTSNILTLSRNIVENSSLVDDNDTYNTTSFEDATLTLLTDESAGELNVSSSETGITDNEGTTPPNLVEDLVVESSIFDGTGKFIDSTEKNFMNIDIGTEDSFAVGQYGKRDNDDRIMQNEIGLVDNFDAFVLSNSTIQNLSLSENIDSTETGSQERMHSSNGVAHISEDGISHGNTESEHIDSDYMDEMYEYIEDEEPMLYFHHNDSKHHRARHDDHHKKGGHHDFDRYPVIIIDYKRVQTAFVITGWIFLACIGKIGELHTITKCIGK